MADTPTLPLWQACLNDYGDSGANNLGVLHPLDVDRAKEMLRDLYDVGEHPSAAEFKSYLATLWPEHPGAQRTFRELWRRLLRNPHHRFRLHRPPARFYKIDRVCGDHGLEPLEPRIRRRVVAALDDLFTTSTASSDERQAELEASVAAARDLGCLRAKQVAQATQRASASSSR